MKRQREEISDQVDLKRQKTNFEELISLIEGGDTVGVEQLIAQMDQQELNKVDNSGYTALMIAVSMGRDEACKMLIPKMTSEAIKAVDNYGNTALHLAARRGMKGACELILQVNQEAIKAVDNYGNTVLHLAAIAGNKEVCGLLTSKMSQKAINAVDIDGYTALDYAALDGKKEFCAVLVDNIHFKKIIKLLNKRNNNSPIQKMFSTMIADFINEKFFGNECSISLDNHQVRLLKLYQIVNLGLLCSNLNQSQEESSSFYIDRVNNYIREHYFELIGVCKSIEANHPILVLAESSDCMSYLLSYLEPHSLQPELLPRVELTGEEVGDSF